LHESKEGPLAELGALLSEFQSVTTSLSHQNKVLERLAFKSMYSREGSIEKAESSTFGWMVDEVAQPTIDQSDLPAGPQDNSDERVQQRKDYEKEKLKQEALRQSTRQEFLTWLNSGRHIFHISGKAGSGKSTLMKFLAKSSRVKRELESWACGHPLIFVRFFFWNSGDAEQMSLEGLYRSLLFETCRQKPDLIPRLFPEIWQDKSLVAAPIHFDEVKEAFNRLIQEASSSESYFCFFIDGLDEIDGDEIDHWRISHDLQSWTAQANNFKLCVSSRPHIPFVQSFANDLNHQISIHELTREDILKFTMAMFEKDPNFLRIKDTYRDLAIETVNASDGVFLWARLAVRSLLKSVGYQASEKDLKRKLQLLPKGLDELFDQILGSIDPDDQPLSDQLFLLTTANFCAWKPIVQNAIAYSWLEDLDDPGFPDEFPMVSCTETEIDERLERVSCLLDRLSRGILEMSRKRSREKDGHDYFSFEVQFLHRSARDYIVDTRKAQMQARMPDFEVIPGIFRLLLAELKFALPTLHDYRPRVWGKFGGEGGAIRVAVHKLFTVMESAHKNCGYDVPSRFFEEASHIIQHHARATAEGIEIPPADETSEFKGYIWGENLQRVGRMWLTIRESNHSPDFLCEVVCRGLQQFLSLDLMRQLKQQNLISGPNLLLVAAQSSSLKLVQQLLHEGRTPTEMVPMEPIRPFDNNWEEMKTIPASQAAKSVWIIFLYRLVEAFFLGYLKRSKDQYLECLEEFLLCNVDCNVQFVVRIFPSFGEFDKQGSDIGDTWEDRSQDKGETDERVVFDLLEFLELVGPSNIEAFRAKVSGKRAQGDQSEVVPVCGPTIIHQRGSISKTLEAIVAAGKFSQTRAYALCLVLESVITPSERLDTPFAFRIS
jgi:hypothetical protein